MRDVSEKVQEELKNQVDVSTYSVQVQDKSLKEAERILGSNNVKYRIVERDGEKLIHTLDYRSDRLNLEVKNDIVINSYVG